MMDFFQHTLDGLLEAGPYALIGLGLTWGFGLLKQINLAYGAGAMLGAYTGSWLYLRFGWPVMSVMLVVVMVTGLVGLYVQSMCFQKVDLTSRQAGIREAAAMAASFAIWMQLEQLCVNLLPNHLIPFPDFAVTHEWSIGPFGMRPDRFLVAVLAVGLAYGMQVWTSQSRMGLFLRATANAPMAAQLSGMKVLQLQRLGIFLACGLAGVAACIVLSLQGQVTPMFGMWMLMKGLTVALIGGLGSTTGVFYGALLLGVVEAHAQAFLGALGRDAVTWGLLLMSLLWRYRSHLDATRGFDE
jgi:branched-chain amino acid transport system permease protein